MKNLKLLRKASGYTQVTLAEALGVAQSVVAGWELGRIMPSADKLPMIADMLHCTIDALYGREPPQEPPSAAAS